MPDQSSKKDLVRLADIRTPPLTPESRRDAGYYLNLLQEGFSISMPISRPMPSVGARVHELRLSDRSGDWRVVYRIDATEIVVVAVFKKTTPQTPARIINLCRQRLGDFDKLT